MTARIRTIVAAALVVAPLALGSAQRSPEQTSDFRWSEQIGSGAWVRSSNVNGKISVTQGTGNRVELVATKRWRTGDPARVRIEARKVGNDVEICALFDDQRSCDDKYEGRSRWRDRDDDRNDVSVDFAIVMPRNVRLRAATVNGSVDVRGATSDVEASAVNGSVDVETGEGPLSASTVNGSVYARITGSSFNHPMSFTTVNGNVIAELPAGAGADIEMTTVNGTLRSDFDLTVRGRIDPRNLNVHVGAPGGPRIRLTTVNGNLELRKR
jgi:Ni/Co efflux regulator RcnB